MIFYLCFWRNKRTQILNKKNAINGHREVALIPYKNKRKQWRMVEDVDAVWPYIVSQIRASGIFIFSYFIYYIVLFYNKSNIQTFIFLYNTLK